MRPGITRYSSSSRRHRDRKEFVRAACSERMLLLRQFGRPRVSRKSIFGLEVQGMAPTKRASKQPGVRRHVARAPRGAASTPAAKSDLYAWAVPAFSTGPPVDHTWVTTYDNRVKVYSSDQQVAAAGECYWYCRGSFHSTGGTPNNSAGFLGQQNGDLTLAKCLVAPNANFRPCPRRAARFSPMVLTAYAINWPIRYSTRQVSEPRRR